MIKTNNSFKIEIPFSGEYNYKLVDGLSRIIRSEKVVADGNDLDVSTENLIPGMYFLRIATEAEIQTTKVIISE